MNVLTRVICWGTFTCVGSFYGGLVTAADTSITQQVEQLQQKVRELEQRVRLLEHPPIAHSTMPPSASASVVAPTPAAMGTAPPAAPITSLDPALESLGRLKDAWKGIENGMSEAQIRARLGEPTRRLNIDRKNVWYYSYPGTGNGSVMFSATNKVMGWQNPPLAPLGFW